MQSTFLSTELFWVSLKWLMVTAVWIAITIGILLDNKKLKRVTYIGMHAGLLPLFKIIYSRTLQLWALSTLLLVVDGTSDIHRTVQTSAAVVTALAEAPVAPVPTPEAKQPQTMQSPPRDSLLRPASVNNMPFTDITEFNEKNATQQATIDWIKERYENWLVTYYYLHQCNKTGTRDLDLIRASLHRELAALGAGETIETNILSAAQGSYEGLYHDIPCDGDHLPGTLAGYQSNMQVLYKLDAPVPTAAKSPANPPAKP